MCIVSVLCIKKSKGFFGSHLGVISPPLMMHDLACIFFFFFKRSGHRDTHLHWQTYLHADPYPKALFFFLPGSLENRECLFSASHPSFNS